MQSFAYPQVRYLQDHIRLQSLEMLRLLKRRTMLALNVLPASLLQVRLVFPALLRLVVPVVLRLETEPFLDLFLGFDLEDTLRLEETSPRLLDFRPSFVHSSIT